MLATVLATEDVLKKRGLEGLQKPPLQLGRTSLSPAALREAGGRIPRLLADERTLALMSDPAERALIEELLPLQRAQASSAHLFISASSRPALQRIDPAWSQRPRAGCN